METKDFAEQLTAARKACGMTQEQLGALVHMSRQGISHWEHGRALPDAETLKALSQALNYDFSNAHPLAEGGENQTASQEEAQGVPAAEKPGHTQRWLYICIAALVLALVLLLVTRPAGQPAVQGSGPDAAPPQRIAEQAEVLILVHQNPITPSIDPALGPEPWWIYRMVFRENAGVDFTMERLTTTYLYGNGKTKEIVQDGAFIEAYLGSNVLRRGWEVGWNGAEPMEDIVSITVRLDGTDALGNVLSSELEILTAAQ